MLGNIAIESLILFVKMTQEKRVKLDSVLLIKKEFRKVIEPTTTDAEINIGDKVEAQNTENAIEPIKKETKPKKQRGQNKNRKHEIQGDLIRICPQIASGLECPNPDCKKSHNIEEYLKTKGKDMGTICPLLSAFGHCKFGLRCRFYNSHANSTTPEPTNVEKSMESELIKNTIGTMDLKNWRQNGTFPKSTEIELLWKNKNEGSIDDLVVIHDDKEVTMRKLSNKKLDFKGKTYLAPLQTVGNLPFRRICKEYGVDVTCCEMILSQSLLNWSQQEWSLMKKHASEDLFGIQITGNNPIVFSRALECINEKFEFDFIDINLGCPVEGITNTGSGSALMEKKLKLEWMIRSANHVLDCPISVKMRTAVRDKKLLADSLIPLVKSWGASLVTLHGRSKEQRYTKLADWDYIQQCGNSRSKDFTFLGNGDIFSPHDYFDKLKNNNVDGIMIGRGALIKPWIFKEIKEQKLYDISANERLEILQKYAKYGMEIWGTDTLVNIFNRD